MANPAALHLVAQDAEDVAVMSAMMQDSVTCPADMAWDKKRHLFALMLNRFRWEAGEAAAGKGKGKPERVRTGMHIHSVLGVRAKNMPQKSKAVLSLLAIMVAEDKEQAGLSHIRFIFSAQAELLLSVEGVNVVMQDVTAPWATKSTPRHED